MAKGVSTVRRSPFRRFEDWLLFRTQAAANSKGQGMQLFLATVLGVGVLFELALTARTGVWSLAPLHPAIFVTVLHQRATESRMLGSQQPVSKRVLALMIAAAVLTTVSAVAVWPGSDAGEKTAALVAAALAVPLTVGMLLRRTRDAKWVDGANCSA